MTKQKHTNSTESVQISLSHFKERWNKTTEMEFLTSKYTCTQYSRAEEEVFKAS